jgi:hypothetical protein
MQSIDRSNLVAGRDRFGTRTTKLAQAEAATATNEPDRPGHSLGAFPQVGAAGRASLKLDP